MGVNISYDSPPKDQHGYAVHTTAKLSCVEGFTRTTGASEVHCQEEARLSQTGRTNTSWSFGSSSYLACERKKSDDFFLRLCVSPHFTHDLITLRNIGLDITAGCPHSQTQPAKEKLLDLRSPRLVQLPLPIAMYHGLQNGKLLGIT